MMVSLPNKAMSCKLENPFVSEYFMFYCNVTELHRFKPRAKETFRIKLQSTLFLQLRFFLSLYALYHYLFATILQHCKQSVCDQNIHYLYRV